MGDIVMMLIEDEDKFIPLLIAGSIVAGMFISAVAKIATGSSREKTTREIAAYIAEGSMTPEQGERLLKTGGRRRL